MAEVATGLEVRGLSVTFDVGKTLLGRKEKLLAVDDVSFDIAPGETLGLVGESGSGKSTTGQAILQLLRPSAGTVLLDGEDIGNLSGRAFRRLRRRLQIVFQDPYSSLNPSMRVFRILEEPLVLHETLSGEQRRERVFEALEQVGLRRGLAERYPHEFSGGQRQRIAIARAIISRPDLIVCDEPVSALDVSTQSQIINLLREIQATTGTSFLFIGHDLAVVRLMSKRTAVMYLGQIVESGLSEEIYTRPAHPYTAALNSAIPVPDPKAQRSREKIILKGDQPSPMRPPSGCRFRTRCPFVMEICANEVPPDFKTKSGGISKCHLHTEGPRLMGDSVLPLISEL